MGVSLEARVPYLDHRVVEFVTSLPSRLKLRGRERKFILKRALSDLIPPDIAGRRKEGFSIPVKHWLKGPLRPMLEEHLSPVALARRGWFRPAAVRRLVDDHLSGKANHSHKLWGLIVLEHWCRRTLDPSLAQRAATRACGGRSA
jgi:asparagine synthase (glutamine-hydrolysing)